MDAAIFGLIVADVIGQPLDVRNPPPPGGLHKIASITLTTGGNVCSTGIAMARLGMKVAATGLVGNDVLGTAMLDILRKAGIDTTAVLPSDKAQTSASVVAVEPGGERCFFHVPGVTALLDESQFRRCFQLFTRCAFVQIGYQGLLPGLTPSLPRLLPELRKLAPNTKIAYETVNPPGPWSELEPILPHLDVFAPSRTEAQVMTGESDPPKMVAAFRKIMKHGLIGIKLDADGCLLDDGKQCVVVPAYKIQVVDTTGAGDSWYAGLLTALRHNMPLEQSGRFANRVAADCCTAIGASTGIRSFQETISRL
jgi:sugar/nucleoside kinase (ribokinase family)